MVKLKDLLQHLTRREVSALVLTTGQRPSVRLGSASEPVDSDELTSDGLVRLLFAAGGSRYLEHLGPRPTTWTTRAEPVGPVSVSATQHGMSLEATFTLPGREAERNERSDRRPHPASERPSPASERPRPMSERPRPMSERPPPPRDPRTDETEPPPRARGLRLSVEGKDATGDSRRRDPRSELESARPRPAVDERAVRDRLRRVSVERRGSEGIRVSRSHPGARDGAARLETDLHRRRPAVETRDDDERGASAERQRSERRAQDEEQKAEQRAKVDREEAVQRERARVSAEETKRRADEELEKKRRDDEERAFQRLEEEAEANLARERQAKIEAESARLAEIRRMQAQASRPPPVELRDPAAEVSRPPPVSEGRPRSKRPSNASAPRRHLGQGMLGRASMQLHIKRSLHPAPEVAAAAVELPMQGSPRVSSRAPGPHGRDLERMLADARAAKASDLHLVAGRPPLVRVAGELRESGPKLAPDVVESMLLDRVPPRLSDRLVRHGSCDFALALPRVGRFRFNVALQRTGYKASIRIVPSELPSLESLELPRELAKALDHHQGLIVIAGPTGHGKTSTMAALVDILNESRAIHIITVEDPVEHIHPRKKAIISQREVGTSAASFASALKGSLRQDPDVIVVGELRDLETVRMALSASETGHLVIGTMNTPSAARTIDRLIDLFPPGDQPQVRATLAGGLRLIVAQRLIPNKERTRMHVACEVLPGSVPLWNLIRDNKTFQIPSLQQRGKGIGVLRLDDGLADLVRADKVELADACAVAEAPDELIAVITGKRPARAAGPLGSTDAAPPLTPVEAEDAPAGARAFLERAGSFFRRGGS